MVSSIVYLGALPWLLVAFEGQAPADHGLCAELSDGRLDVLAGGPLSVAEVRQVACNMVANIFANGTIIASPSKGIEPIYTWENGSGILENDYYYMWQRDAGLTMRTLLRVGGKGPAVKKQAATYAKMWQNLWAKESPNKCAPWGQKPYVSTWCSMIGEVKFFVNQSVYDGGWGRNQNDGPAINALVMMDILTKLDPDESLADIAKNVSITGVTYAGHNSQDSTIDPWEMLYGQHFFVQAIHHRAFAAGAEQAGKGNWTGTDDFSNWAEMMPHLLEVHWNATSGALGETVARPWFKPVGPKCLSSEAGGKEPPCELDVAILLGALYSEAAPGLGSDYPQTISPHDSRMLATAHYLVESMAPTYEINHLDDEADLPGVLIGRYPGDEYSGVIMSGGEKQICEGPGCANPWFLATHSLADVLYKSATAAVQGKLTPGRLNSKFLRGAMDWSKTFSKRSSGDQDIPSSASALAEMLLAAGDGVLQRAKHHAGPGMHMSEQIYRGNNKYPGVKPGTMFGARDLTWSYASLLDALASRVETVDEMGLNLASQKSEKGGI